MADPEGGEFCAFLRSEVLAGRLHGLVVDSADPEAQARWWAGVYGVSVTGNDGWFTVEGVPGMPVLTTDFAPVPGPKTVNDRIHWDVTVPGMTPLVAAGARALREPAAASAGTCWPARRETSSARSPSEDTPPAPCAGHQGSLRTAVTAEKLPGRCRASGGTASPRLRSLARQADRSAE
jgi:hypothetical protein